MLKKIMTSVMALALVAGAVSAVPLTAEARRGGVVAGAIIGGVVAGALIAGAGRAYAHRSYAGPACYEGPRRCGWHDRHCYYNRYGDYVCRGGEYRCYRQRVCD